MNESNSPALTVLLPPNGIVSTTVDANPILSLSRDLCRIASFLQQNRPNAKLFRIADWWEHDGLSFEKGELDFHALFEIIGTPRSLLQAMSDDDRVFVGIATSDRSWYLRFRVDWDDNGEVLSGEYSITLDFSLTQQYAKRIAPQLECSTRIEEATKYFARILA